MMLFKDKRLDLGIVISIIIHILLFLLFSRSTSASTGAYEDIREVTLLDQSYRPEVAKVVSKGSIWGEIKETPAPATGSYGGSDIVTPAIDLNVKLDRSQAKIDLNRYTPQEGVGEVIKIGSVKNGTMKSTEEILAEKPISLAKNLPRGAGAEGGTGIGVYGGIGRQAQAPSIKIDKKPPPTQTSQIGMKIEEKVEEKLKIETKGTSISLAGPIAERQILKKMLPQYPAWCLQKGISGVVKIRIEVNPEGSVRENIRVEISSGYPDLDQSVVNAVKAWLFAPLPSNVKQEIQWGIITFKFVCG
jgi:TonB family protein|uniref:Energy transducer TonB n=1 Tax=candidate division WOR-3 bacterium TaxID=2052148 RepID=A0A7V3RIE5_UNCW3